MENNINIKKVNNMSIVRTFGFFLLLVMLGCNHVTNKNMVNQSGVGVKKEKIFLNKYEFVHCQYDNDCTLLYDCYHTYYLADDLFEYQTHNEAFQYFNPDSLLECTIVIYNTDSTRQAMADYCLYNFYYKAYLKSIEQGMSPIPTGNLDKSFLKKWNSTKAFEICILYMGRNGHDSMGHGDCSNLGYRFLHNIVLPKIKSINGQVPDIYLEKNMPGDRLTDYDDCFDTYFNNAYPRLKKAWEEGKIELKTNTNH